MIKFIIFLIIFWIYSIVVFLLGRGYGNAENFQYINNLKNENSQLKHSLNQERMNDAYEKQADNILFYLGKKQYNKENYKDYIDVLTNSLKYTDSIKK